MRITYDPAKREATLQQRGLDFADAAIVFQGDCRSFEDSRRDYGETRIISYGQLHGRMVVIVWTPRGEARHVISMRKANAKEQARYR